MEDKQCKQIKRFSTIAIGNNYFFVLDDKSKQRYKVRINIIEGYDPYQIKNEELSGNISKFPPVANPDIVNYFLFSLSLLNEEELKAY